MASRKAGSGFASGASWTSVCTSSSSKMRSDAADRLLQVGVDAAQLLDRPVHQQQRRHERRELARRQPPHRNLAAAVPQRAGDGDAAEKLHQRRQQRQHARHLQVGAIQLVATRARTSPPRAPSAPNALTMRWPENASPATCDRCSSRFLAPARDGAQLPPEPHQRIDRQRRAGHAQQREPRVVVEEQRRKADQRRAIRARDRRPFPRRRAAPARRRC